MVILLTIIGAVVALVLLALVLLPSFIDESAIIELAQEQVRSATGGELSIDGGVELSVLPKLIVNLEDAALDLPPQGPDGTRMLANVDEVGIELGLIALLLGNPEVGEVRLLGTDLTMFDTDGEPSTEIQLSKLTVEGLNTANSPMRINGQVDLLSPDGAPPIRVTMTGSVRIPSDFSKIGIDSLQTDITGALPDAIKTTLSGEVNLAPLQADLALLASTTGGDIDGDLMYAATASPQIDLTFTTERLDLDKLSPPMSGDQGAEDETAPEEETGIKPPPLPVPVGPLKDLDMRLAVTADALLSNGQEVTDAQLLLRVVDGISDLKYLRGVLHKGQLDTTLRIDVRKPVVKVDLEGGLQGVDIDSLMASLGSDDMAAGRVDIDWEIETEGVTTDDLKMGLDGDINLNGRNVKITAVSMQEMMCNAIAQVNQEEITNPMPEVTDVSVLKMVVTFDDGKAQLANLEVATKGVALGGQGVAALDDLKFQTRFIATVDEELSKLDKACRVEERYAAVDWPIRCSGVLTGDANEWCALDLDSIVRQLLENEARSELSKKADKLGKEAGTFLKNLFGN